MNLTDRSRVQVMALDATHPELHLTPIQVHLVDEGFSALYLANDCELGMITEALADGRALVVLTELLVFQSPSDLDRGDQ